MSLFNLNRAKYNVEAAGFSLISEARERNEDNMVINGRYLEKNHSNATIIGDADRSASAAVFDGIGGDPCGEAASYIAAEFFAKSGTINKSNYKRKLIQLTFDMNKKIEEYADMYDISKMGTTMAALYLSGDHAFGMHLGDSRIYRFSNGKLEQLTRDHVISRPGYIKGHLAGYLGGTFEDVLTPDIFTLTFRENDIFFLCTDGITDIVPDEIIRNVLEMPLNKNEMLEQIKLETNKRAPMDNCTAIIIKVTK